jgi:lycopene cyclase domain-containing protein
MRSEYLMVLALVLFFPLALSRDSNLPFRGRWLTVLRSIVCVSVPFWAWDIIATARGHWSFNPRFILGYSIAGLPVEEWLFFLVVGFASLFTWESVKYFARRRQ